MTPQQPEPPTDPFVKAKEHLAATPDATPRLNLIDKKKATIAVATALLGGAAFTATRLVDGEPTPLPKPTKPAEEAENNGHPATPVAHPPTLATGREHPVAGGTISPNEEVSIAQGVTDDMDFPEAFHTARAEVGTEGVFGWRGDVYNTFTREEWSRLSLPGRQTFLANVNYRPTPPPFEEIPDLDDDQTPPEPIEPVLVQTTIDGKPAIGIDDDHDGLVDAVVVVDPTDNSVMAVLDYEGDENLDTVAQLDPETFEVLESASIDEPFQVTVAELNETSIAPPDVAPTDLSVGAQTDDSSEDDDDTDEIEGDDSGTDDDPTDQTDDSDDSETEQADLHTDGDNDYNNRADVSGMAQ